VKLLLSLRADLEHITNITPTKDIRWYVKIKCTSCGEVNDKWTYLSAQETSDISGSRGTANLVMKCQFCKRENSINIVEGYGKPLTLENSGIFVPVMCFECRGSEITAYQPRMGWTGEGEKGNLFEIDLSEGDWTDFDDRTKESVGIYNVAFSIEKTK